MATTSPSHSIELTDNPAGDVRDLLADPLIAYNEALLGPPGIHPLAALIRSQDDGRLLGGLWGRTSFRWLFVELLFIPEDLRGKGIGAELLKSAEGEAKARGCIGAWLDTLSPDACRFYVRQGYEVFGAIPDFPPGNARSFLAKRFSPSPTESQPG